MDEELSKIVNEKAKQLSFNIGSKLCDTSNNQIKIRGKIVYLDVSAIQFLIEKAYIKASEDMYKLLNKD